jgi:hypothetical protein
MVYIAFAGAQCIFADLQQEAAKLRQRMAKERLGQNEED